MADWKIGDLAVCVRKPKSIHLNTPEVGDHLRVNNVGVLTRKRKWWGTKTALCLGFEGKENKGWEIFYFRPVTAADEQFTASIRACRDAHSPAPVA